MWTDPEDKISSDIVMVLVQHQRLAREVTCTSRPCESCIATHRERVARFVSRRVPVDFVLPAFPGKSPNKSKVIGVAPDMAEQLSLDFLHKICDQIHEFYAPGARIIICSDGHVFSDLVHIADSDITFYQAELRGMIRQTGSGSLDVFGLDREYRGRTYEKMRLLLMERYGEDVDELKRQVREGGDLLTLYRGITRFLLEDADRPDYKKSRAALQRECRERAYGVIQRSRAWGRLIAERFPEAVRLSIHPQPCGSDKLGINLLEASDNWITPWHGTAVDVGGRFVLMKRYQAEALGADLVGLHGRPSHYVASQSHLSSNSSSGLVA
ncbi:MAG TPA: isocyanide synthase family protein [Pseudonocardiaceae bacterium]|nr:isocyanide synthase family protein [Pseudonocardiaceae bacterium]